MSHHEFSPSKFPQLEKCLHFASGEVGESAHRGTLQHTYLEKLFTATVESGKPGMCPEANKWALDKLTNDERAYVQYAYFKILKIISDYEVDLKDVVVEEQVVAYSSKMSAVDGTMDIGFYVPSTKTCVVIDYKSGQDRDYQGQCKVYGLAYAQETGAESVDTYVVYGKIKKADDYSYKTEDLVKYFDNMMDKIDDRENIEPCINDYCNWCADKMSCPKRKSLALSAKKVVPESPLKGITAKTNLEKLNPEKAGALYSFAKDLEKWCKDVISMTKDRLLKDEDVSGYAIKVGQKTELPDTKKIFDILEDDGFTFEEVLKAMGTSQKALKDAIGVDKFKELILPECEKVVGAKTIVKSKKEIENATK